MKSVSIYSLKVRFAYAVKHEEVEKMFTARKTIERVPYGEVHIFELVTSDGVSQTVDESFCDISHAVIGESWDEKDKRPDNLKLCTECEKAWKEHPRSPWRAFVNGEKAN